jgi:beta-lactamase regulating signal transducer with metallopeptidase domain
MMRALGWALIHSLWQCLGIAALAAALMAFSRRPPIRYLVAVTALALMLAVPAATSLLLLKSTAPVHVFPSTEPGAFISAAPAVTNASVLATAHAPVVAAVTAPSSVLSEGAILANPPMPNVLPWLVAAWLGGVAFFSLRFAGGFLLLEHRRRSGSILPSPHVLAICHALQAQLGLERAIRYLECSWLQAPAVIGWFRPIVLLPVTALIGLSEAQLRAVIAHELAHIRRFDGLVNLFQILVETLLFYHPAMWWLNKRIRAERELCCDEIALSVSGDRFEYAKALTLMAQWESAPALAMAANRGPLAERILHILGRQSSGIAQRMIGLTGSALFLVAALAAANALFVVAAPPIAHAKERLSSALSSSGGNHAMHRVIAAIVSAAPAQPSATTGREPAPVVPGRIEDNSQPDTLVPPSFETLALPQEVAAVAANAPPAAPTQPAFLAATIAAPPESAESITVTATPLPHRPAVDEFIYSYPTANRATDKIARWLRPICPIVWGVPQRYGAFIATRLTAIARKAGAPVDADPKCRHNIEIVFTTKPQMVADDIHKNHRPFLGWFDNLHQAEELAKVTHDIQAWYLTASVDGNGFRIDNPRQAFLNGSEGSLVSIFSNGATTLYNVIIVADLAKLGDYEMGQLADYIAMLALSQPKSFDACWEVPSITNLLSKDCEPARKTATLSDNDAAFLSGLYKMSPASSVYMQRNQIRYFLERHTEPRR